MLARLERSHLVTHADGGIVVPDVSKLQEFLESEGLSKYSWPESIEVFEDFPRTPSLKVVKRDLVKAIHERASTPA